MAGRWHICTLRTVERRIVLDDGVADADWLESAFGGGRCCCWRGVMGMSWGLAGCGAVCGDVAREVNADDDAALFSKLFWSEVVGGANPDEALSSALLKAPAGMGSMLSTIGSGLMWFLMGCIFGGFSVSVVFAVY